VRGAAEARLRDPGEAVGLRIDPARVALFPVDGTAAARP
jgi:hypothetical protein